MENTDIKPFLERHTSTTSDGKKQVNAFTALNELDVRDKTRYKQVEEIQQAIAGLITLYEELEQRLNEIKPKIQVVSMDEANSILKGK
jgi:hypothetical protein